MSPGQSTDYHIAIVLLDLKIPPRCQQRYRFLWAPETCPVIQHQLCTEGGGNLFCLNYQLIIMWGSGQMHTCGRRFSVGRKSRGRADVNINGAWAAQSPSPQDSALCPQPCQGSVSRGLLWSLLELPAFCPARTLSREAQAGQFIT